MIWKILQIEKTKDEDVIRGAYRERLRFVNPEDDEEGFKELRRAYEEAMEYATRPEEDEVEENLNSFGGHKNDVDRWIDRVMANYNDVKDRCDEQKWNVLLHDRVCDGLDTEMEAAEKLLVFFMTHNTMPRNIWEIVDRRFHYSDNLDRLKERFPENYLEFICWQINNDSFIDFALFDGKTDDHVDEFVGKIYDVNRMINTNELNGVQQILKELKRYDITHPYVDTQEARYYLAKAMSDAAMEEDRKNALEIMEELDFEYSDNHYIERIYADALAANGQEEKAIGVYQNVLEMSPTDYMASIGIARCVFQLGDLEDAKEKTEDILDEQVQNPECLSLLDEINEKLVERYTQELQQDKTVEITCKLGWCYYQQQKFEEGIHLLDEFDGTDTYDYVNLRCRLYLANEQYDKAYPLVKRWKELIEATVDDGSHEMTRRLNRITLAQFSLAICTWEQEYHLAESEEDKKKAYEESISLIQKAVEGEKNHLVKLTYMDQYARFYLDAKEYEKCVEVCTEIIEQEREFFPAYVQRQKANYEMKNAREVIDDYFACKDIYPSYPQPYLYAAEVFYAYNQLDDVKQVLADAKEAEIESDTLELYRIYVMHYENPNDANKKKALISLETLRSKVYESVEKAEAENQDIKEVTDIKNFADLEKEYALLHWDFDRVDEALKVVNQYLEKKPYEESLILLQADLLAQDDKYDEIIASCKNMLDKEPENINVHLKMAKAYEWMRDYKTAVEEYKKILLKNSTCQTAVARLMYIYDFFGDREKDIDHFKEAEKYATQFIQLNGSPEGYIERACARSKLFAFEETIADCKEAIAIDPDSYYAYVYWGVALFHTRQVEEARDIFLKAISMDDKKSQTPYRRLAECYMILKEYSKAIEMYETIMRIWEGEFGLCEEVANCYALLGQYKKSCELYLSYPKSCLKAYNEKKTDDSHHSRSAVCYCDCITKCSENEDYKLGDKYIKKAMKEYLKITDDRLPGNIDNIVEYYRDKGDYKTACKYAETILANAKGRGVPEERCKGILFAYATVLFECGKKEECSKVVKRYFDIVFADGVTEEKLFEDKRYIAMNAFNFAIMNICVGELEKAKFYLNKVPGCTLCVMCVCGDCFEYYFATGLIAELEGDIAKAKQCYEKAIAIKGYYPSALFHLRKITGNK